MSSGFMSYSQFVKYHYQRIAAIPVTGTVWQYLHLMLFKTWLEEQICIFMYMYIHVFVYSCICKVERGLKNFIKINETFKQNVIMLLELKIFTKTTIQIEHNNTN